MTIRTLACLAAFVSIAATAAAQGTNRPDPSRKWEITDNSFLVEEAFNQEPGVVQNIFTWMRSRDGGWAANFTQEWPAPAMTHQLSYTLAYASINGTRGIGDTLINYRFQLRTEAPGRPAISPRLSVILPTGRESAGLGAGSAGLQVNVPASKQFGDFYLHVNGGYTWVPDSQQTPTVAASGIWRVAPMLNLMLEGVIALDESATLSPGVRGGWNFGDTQLVVGLAAPLTRADGRWTPALLAYLSYELPFR